MQWPNTVLVFHVKSLKMCFLLHYLWKEHTLYIKKKNQKLDFKLAWMLSDGKREPSNGDDDISSCSKSKNKFLS